MPMPNPFTYNFGHSARRLYAAANKIAPSPDSPASTTAHGSEILVADHLYGLAVECTVKQLLHDYCPALKRERGDLSRSCRGHLGGGQRSISSLSPDAPTPLRELVNTHLSSVASLNLCGRTQVTITAKLQALIAMFNDWSINHRYAADIHSKDADWIKHQNAAKEACKLLDEAKLSNAGRP